MANAYAHSRNESEFRTPTYPEQETNRYAVPTVDGPSPWMDSPSGAYAPTLRAGAGTVPDATRLGSLPRRDYRPNPDQPSDTGFYSRKDADNVERRRSESVHATGWYEDKSGDGYEDPSHGANRWARNPRETPPAESRITQRLSPHNYAYTRPFAQGQPKMGERFFNGMHFSMASFRRDYEIMGMAPPREWRNTLRVPPTPNDAVTDYPSDVVPITQTDGSGMLAREGRFRL